MFENLSNRLSQIFNNLKRRGILSKDDVSNALREVRLALLEADVALPVVKDFIGRVQTHAVGQAVLHSITPGQMVVKIVHDTLVEMLGKESRGITYSTTFPTLILIVGLQGSGKTTTTAKIALRLKKRHNKKVLMVSLDMHRPAAQEQLAILGKQSDIATFPVTKDQIPIEIAKQALVVGREHGFDVIVFDTAGRLHIDQKLMVELTEVCDIIKPDEILLVTDAMTGQVAATLAQAFNTHLDLTGIVLTRIDGDTRGGAALSMQAMTGKPIKFLGTGEKLEELDDFYPDRLAKRILGMGDIVSLVEKATDSLKKEEVEKISQKMLEGRFDLNDLLLQIRQIRKIGDLTGLMRFLPIIGRVQKQLEVAKIDEKLLLHQEAIILSMTPLERQQPGIIKASRKQRIAGGCGLTVQDVNRLLKQYQQVTVVMKEMQKRRWGVVEKLFSGDMPRVNFSRKFSRLPGKHRKN